MYVQLKVRVFQAVVAEELDDLTNVQTPHGSLTARPRETFRSKLELTSSIGSWAFCAW